MLRAHSLTNHLRRLRVILWSAQDAPRIKNARSFTSTYSATPWKLQLKYLDPKGLLMSGTMSGTSDSLQRTVVYDHVQYDIVQEGLAEILGPSKEPEGKAQTQEVFYNPVQQFNRDLSVLAIRVFGEDYRTLCQQRNGHKRSEHLRRGKKRKRVLDKATGETQVQTEFAHGGAEPVRDGRDTATAFENAARSFKEGSNGGEEAAGASHASSSIGKINAPGATALPDVPNGPRDSFTLRILDALSATGLRALRYAKEIPQPTTTTANDLLPAATDSIRLNVRHNGVGSSVFPTSSNALGEMYRVASTNKAPLPDGSQGKYHVIDLDPYGTAAPFLDAAVQAVEDGGLLCVTCTDAGVFASTGYSEKTFSQYGGLPMKGPHAHEAGLRLVLNSIASSAARYGIAIEPLLSLSIDFYVRVFVRLRRSPNEVKFLAGKTIAVYSCDAGCGAWSTQPIGRTLPRDNKLGDTVFRYSLGQGPVAEPFCEHCGFRTHLAGPMWGGPIHNPFFIQRILDLIPSLDEKVYPTIPRIEGMLSTARDETLLPPEIVETMATKKPATGAIGTSPAQSAEEGAPASAPIPRLPAHLADPHPFFLSPSVLAKVLHCEAPSHAGFRSALLGLGYRTTRSHTKAGSIRTDAPWSVIWEVMREWTRQHAPVKEGVYKEGTAGRGIMRWARDGGVGDELKELKEIAGKAEDRDQLKSQLEAFLWRLGSEGGGTRGDGKETGDGKDGQKPPRGLGKLKVVFDGAKGKEPETKKLTRYQRNPRPNWGPMNRAKGPS